MSFNRKEVSILLTKCHRRCCICHRFCGIKIETHHISESKDDSIENAIPVCFECHAEIKLYDDSHPKGRKFSPEELLEHKKQWLEICKSNPDIFVRPFRRGDVGPLHALSDELRFNKNIQSNYDSSKGICPFETKQFDRALSEGYLSLLHDDLAKCLIETYRKMKAANISLDTLIRAPDQKYITRAQEKLSSVVEAVDSIEECSNLLENYLAAEKNP